MSFAMSFFKPSTFDKSLLAIMAAFLLVPSMSFAAEASVDPGNEKNPYDFIGRMHNEALDASVSDPDLLPKDAMALSAALTSRIESYVSSSSGLPASCDRVLEYDAVSRALTEEGRAINNHWLGERRAEYAQRLRAMTTSPEGSLKEKLFEIRELESEILSVFNEQEALPLLVGASVARYSAVYWHDNYKTDGVWNFSDSNLDDANPYFLTGADLEAAIGYVVVQALTGGEITWSGALGSAAVGSLIALIGSLL